MAQTIPADGHGKKFSDFTWYLGYTSFSFLAVGITQVLTPLIVTIFLNSPADRVGLAQSLTMLPMLVLLLFGGAKADRTDLRSWLFRLHTAHTFPTLALAYMLYTGTLTYWLFIAYAMVMASIGAFAFPARDSMLSRVIGKKRPGGMQRAVGFAISTQNVAQIVGIVIAGQAQTLGLFVLPLIVGVSYLSCALTIRQVAPAPPTPGKSLAGPGYVASVKHQMADIREGIVESWQSERIRAVMIMMFFSSVLFVGAFMVMLPLMVRDVYGGDAFMLSLMLLCFTGSIGLSSWLIAHRPIKHQGRMMMLSSAAGAVVMVVLHFNQPLWAFFALVIIWGLFGGISSSMSRTIVQTAAADSHRARILSVFTLATFAAGAPVGSLTTGYLIKEIGIFNTALVAPASMIFIWLGVRLFTPLWHIQENPDPARLNEASDQN